MSTRKPHHRNRALRPAAEGLETRQLLSATVSGTDIDGDQWTLQLVGPGSVVVTKQKDASGNPTALTANTEIDTITVGGTDPLKSQLIGTVKKGANGDGKVFFQHLNELPNHSETLSGDGLVAINMPNFWLGNTAVTPTSTTTTTPTPTPPSILVPDGVDSLVFGGVDTTHNRAATPAASAQSDTSSVTLGLPQYGGTRVLIDQSISSTEAAPPASGSTTPTTLQHAVVFAVAGRLDLFQANSIVGNAATPPGQFLTNNPTATGFGGTWVVSGTAGVAPFLANATLTGGAATGQIGDIRIGGNATNLSALVFETPGAANGANSDAKISNFSIGGETDNVLVVAPIGLHNAYFGLGMDKTEIRTHVINSLQANRGALNSTVVTDRTLSRAQFGGDVVNTNILTGIQQNFADIINTVDGQKGVSAFSATPSPAPAPDPTGAQIGGGMQVLVAGDVTDSVFSASVQPGKPATPPTSGPNIQFGTPQDLVLPGGEITAKVEGKINNTNATPDMPNKAFYAQHVNLKAGPVIPPNVPQAPYSGPLQPRRIPGVHPVRVSAAATATTATRTLRAASTHVHHGAATPKGPGK